MRTLQLTLDEAMEVCKALTNEHRINILRYLNNEPLNVNELSDMLKLPFSTAAVNVKKLEDVGLISTEMIPGRGTQKVNSKKYDRIIIDLTPVEPADENNVIMHMPIGEYVDCEVEPTCGLASETGFIGILDDPRQFYEPNRKDAQLLWFRSGFVEYRFPNRVPYGSTADELEFSVEVCSEAPYYKTDWPSDITVWINDVEVSTWTSPGDFGGKRGFLTPQWWTNNRTQYGQLKHWSINKSGCFIDGLKMSEVVIEELKLNKKPFISVRLGIKKDALNVGGINLFGAKFGNYEQDLILKVYYSNKND